MRTVTPTQATKQRGRPLKFGRPARVLALTLPEDVVEWLGGIHPDPAWAVVSLFEKLASKTRRGSQVPPKFDLARLSPRLSLILIDPRLFRALPGVSVIRISSTTAFLALEEGQDIANLEIAIADQRDDPRTSDEAREELQMLLDQVRAWRRSLRFATRSIVVVEERTAKRRRIPPKH
jgi:hypothetical protein